MWDRYLMASIRLQPPEPFTYTKPDEWLCWKKRFDNFVFNTEGDERQVRSLLYCLGEEAEDVLALRYFNHSQGSNIA